MHRAALQAGRYPPPKLASFIVTSALGLNLCGKHFAVHVEGFCNSNASQFVRH